MKCHGRCGWSLSAFLALTAPLLGQGTSATFRTSSQMVLVPITVIDRHGRTVDGLRKENFTVLEDQTPRQIISFAGDDAPCSVGIVLDVSGSMRQTLGPAKAVTRIFLENSNPADEFLLLTVSSQPTEVSGFTSDTAALERAFSSAPSGGRTALIDTVYLALSRMRHATRPRRALLILSDGMDNHSRYFKSELMRAAVEADTQIYTIIVDGTPAHTKALQQIEEHHGRYLLHALSERTGGMNFGVRDSASAENAAMKATRAIRSEYVIGYQPQQSTSSGKWHTVRVKLDVPGTSVYSRGGYYER